MSSAPSSAPPAGSGPPGGAAASDGLTLHRSPARQRLEALEKEHRRLLLRIGKLKAALERSEREARDASTSIDTQLAPLGDAARAVLRELSALLEDLLGPDSRLSRRDKARVRRAYLGLLPDLTGKPGDEGEDGDGRRDGMGAGGDASAHRSSSGEPRQSPQDEPPPHASAARPPDGAAALRTAFRRLVASLHPDREPEGARRSELTAVMKDVTRAYEAGDVARLLELERRWLVPAAGAAADEGEDLARRSARLLEQNAELRRQLRRLTRERKELRQSLPEVPDAQPGQRSSLTDGVEALVAQMRSELSALRAFRDFTVRFVRDEISLEEFLAGPPGGVPGAGEGPF